MSARFFIITNDGARAARTFYCHLGNLPASIAVVDNPWHFAHVPDGAQVRCLWFGAPGVVAAWEGFWWARRLKGGVEPIDEADWNRILDWAEVHRRAPTLALLYGIGLDEAATADPDDPAADAGAAAPAVEQAVVAIPDAPTQPESRKARWS